MVIEIEDKFICESCEEEYDSEEDARECEKKHLDEAREHPGQRRLF